MRMCVYRVSQYGGRCDWLKNDQFLRDLEGDSVDAEILDEELRLLEDQQPKTYALPTKHKHTYTIRRKICRRFIILLRPTLIISSILL